MALTPAGPAPRPSPEVPPSLATARGTAARSSGRWLLALLAPLTCGGLDLLLGGAVVLDWAVLGGDGSSLTHYEEQRGGAQRW